jgi:hypothetical protein
MTTKQIRARGMNRMIQTMQHLESKVRSHGQRPNAELIADPNNILEKVRVSLLHFLQSHDAMGTFNKQINLQKYRAAYGVFPRQRLFLYPVTTRI